jgi:hypothetical protein
VIDDRALFERAATWFDPPGDILERMTIRRDRRRRNRRLGTAAMALIVAGISAAVLLRAFGNFGRHVPAVRPPTGTIVFSRSVDGSQTYLYANPAGGAPHLLTNRHFDVFRISADGSQVLYPGRGDPAVVELGGSHPRLLRPRVPMFPFAWSPDGTRIVGLGFPTGEKHSTGLYTASADDGGDQVQVTSHRQDEAIGYSPDGSRILFLRPANKIEGSGPKDLYSVRVDGSGLVRLSPAGTVLGPFDAGVAGTPTPVWDLRSASWSPDGTSVAFAAAITDHPRNARRTDVRRGLFVVGADGSDAHQIVPSAQILDAQWSPDGRWIAFTQANPDRPDIFIVHPDGTGLRAVTSSSDGLASWGPVWAPDGSALLFVRNAGLSQFDSELWIVNIDGSGLTRFTDTPAYYFSYGWSPVPRSS